MPCLMIHVERKPQSLAVLCDFDGTITLTDTFAYILKKYAQGDWQQYDGQYERGELRLQDIVKKQGMMIKTPEMVLIAEMERVIGFRPNFDKLITYCRTNKIPIGVVSAGLDFVAYVGDGPWDLPALKLAEYRFAVKGSKLAGLCRQQNILAREISDFQEVIATLQYDVG